MEFILTAYAALLHEAGHIIAILLCGGSISKIKLLPCGITIYRGGKSRSYRSDIVVALAGPLVNFILFFVFSASRLESATIFSYVNLSLGILNMLPIRSLDGGTVLESALCLFIPSDRAYCVTKVISFVFLVLLWMTAVYLLIGSKPNISLYSVSVFLFFRIFCADGR